MEELIKFETKAEKQARYEGLVTPSQLIEETQASFGWDDEPEALRFALNVLIKVQNGYEDGMFDRIDSMKEMLTQAYEKSAKSVSDIYELEEESDALHEPEYPRHADTWEGCDHDYDCDCRDEFIYGPDET